MKIGLALAGGGAKAAAHIGVLKALEEENIKIECISGTSSGSIIATLYAIGFSADEIMSIYKKYCKKIKYVDFLSIIKLIIGLIFKEKIDIPGLNNGKKIEKMVRKYCEAKQIKNIDEISMPLMIPTVSLENGEVCVFSSVNNRGNQNWISDKITYINEGKISEIVTASCAYPGVFYPVKYKNKKLIDGGIRENIPWKELKEIGAEKVIASCFEERLDNKCCDNFIEIISRALSFSNHELLNYELDGVDFLIKTKLDNIGLLDNSKTDLLYEKGYKSAKIQIKKLLFA